MAEESRIEGSMVRRIKAAGGLCYKFTSPGNAGVPDRIVVTPQGKVIFVELKAPNGRLSRAQRIQIQYLRSVGCDVRVLRGMQEVNNFLHEVLGDEV